MRLLIVGIVTMIFLTWLSNVFPQEAKKTIDGLYREMKNAPDPNTTMMIVDQIRLLQVAQLGKDKALHEKANSMMRMKDPLGAMKIYKQLIKDHPDIGWLNGNIGFAYFTHYYNTEDEESLGHAKWYVEECLAMEPEDFDCLYGGAYISLVEEKYEDSLEYLQKILNIAPYFYIGRYSVATIYKRTAMMMQRAKAEKMKYAI